MKARVTVSLDPAVLAEADRVAKRLGLGTRSAAVERALELLVSRAREADIEASLDAYYAGRTAPERAEEKAMVRAFNRSQRRHDLDEEGG